MCGANDKIPQLNTFAFLVSPSPSSRITSSKEDTMLDVGKTDMETFLSRSAVQCMQPQSVLS